MTATDTARKILDGLADEGYSIEQLEDDARLLAEQTANPAAPAVDKREVIQQVLRAEPAHGTSADAILNELHQHGWKVVPR